MSLPPSYQTHRIGSPSASHTLELYPHQSSLYHIFARRTGTKKVDLICPFSKKILQSVRTHVVLLIESNKVDLAIILRQTPQPWHASSTLVHEAVLGVSKTLTDGEAESSYKDPKVVESFQKFFFELIDNQQGFYDEPTSKESPVQTRARLADLASATIPGLDREKYLENITVTKSNGGTPVTAQLKLAIRYGRLIGIHVTPTVALDGLIEPDVSSSFGQSEWYEFLENKVLPKGSKL